MSEHHYVSTACQHELHNQCRQVCKFCPATCACDCHAQVGFAMDARTLTERIHRYLGDTE